jgi:low affinity Fe/Cu permease
VQDRFQRITDRLTLILGSLPALVIATLTVIIWLITGPIFGFSDTWLLIINTVTTIVTFLMVFVIQNSQNRSSLAQHIKLDELIRAIEKAENTYIGIEKESEKEIIKREEDLLSHKE